jgi:putative membrane protein
MAAGDFRGSVRKIRVKDNMQKAKFKNVKMFFINALFILIFARLAVSAHDGKPHDYADLLLAWSFDPLIIGSLALSAGIYFRGVFNLWREAGSGKGIKIWEAWSFAGGWFALFVALVSPLHSWGEVLFSAHMTQHEILMLIAAPLFVLSKPFAATIWAIPRKWRGKSNNLLKSTIFDQSWRFVSLPFVAWLIHAIALWMWHIPFLFQATLESDLIHTLQHAGFFLSALLFWWAIAASPRGFMSYGAGVLYLFTTSIHSGLLGAFLTFTNTVWYPAYEKTTASWGLSAVEDQQLGGLIMWAPAGIVYIAAGLIMFAGWLRDSEKRVLLREKQLFAPEIQRGN